MHRYCAVRSHYQVLISCMLFRYVFHFQDQRILSFHSQPTRSIFLTHAFSNKNQNNQDLFTGSLKCVFIAHFWTVSFAKVKWSIAMTKKNNKLFSETSLLLTQSAFQSKQRRKMPFPSRVSWQYNRDTTLLSQIANFYRLDLLFRWITPWICTIYFYPTMQFLCLANA